MRNRHRDRCPEFTEAGTACRQFRNGTPYCPQHDPRPEYAEKRKELARSGGRASGVTRRAKAEAARALAPTRLQDATDALRLVEVVTNGVLTDQLDNARARVLLKAAGTVLSHARLREIQDRLNQVEETIGAFHLGDVDAWRGAIESIREMRRAAGRGRRS
ncbi:MAG: hypothetical protein O7H41_20820 [Planctomycetota bacterium]|nr:hypothetical protein [Planctomycetota bacterium]